MIYDTFNWRSGYDERGAWNGMKEMTAYGDTFSDIGYFQSYKSIKNSEPIIIIPNAKPRLAQDHIVVVIQPPQQQKYESYPSQPPLHLSFLQ